jgi:hypothetical protein
MDEEPLRGGIQTHRGIDDGVATRAAVHAQIDLALHPDRKQTSDQEAIRQDSPGLATLGPFGCVGKLTL